MNYKKALKILDLDKNYDYKILKSNYYIKALKYHPDKNDDDKSKEKFQEINDAYNFLKHYIHNENYNINDNYRNNSNSQENTYDYKNLLYKFVISLNDQFIIHESDIELFNNIFNNENVIYLLNFLKLLPSNKLNTIYQYLINIKLIKDSNLTKEIEKILNENTKDEIKYIINPSIDNLLNHEIFKINLDGEEYYVPLWHNEIIYDNSNSRLIFECIPEISDNILIDDDNNIFINVFIELQSLLEKESYEISIGNKRYKINIDDIKIKKSQIITINNDGISKIDYENIYNVEKKSNIYINISLY
jgi:DnaJ-class molecular chaperone